MSTAEDTAIDTPDYLNMSDEEMLNASAPPVTVATVVADATGGEPDADDSSINMGDEAPAGAAGTASTEGDEEGGPKHDDDDEPATVAPEKKEAPAAKVEDTKVVAPKVEADKPAEVVIDYKTEYERIIAPFKANGRDVAVNSVDDAVALMQMGANYNKKMAALKPNLRLMKLLENNGLLSEEKIGFLIDLDKKSPDAISKLVKDSGLNPLDLDTEKASGYKPTIHTVDDREIALDTVLEEISTTPTYNRTLEVVSKKWDGPSKRVVADSPQLLQVINNHIASGVYDLISTEIENERMFGRLNGLSDIEAYRQVGDAIQARGGFNHLGSSQGKTATEKVIVAPKPKKVEDDKRNEQRRAASSTKPANVGATAEANFNPLAMSDAEFAAHAAKRTR